MTFTQTYSDLIEKLPTRAFLTPAEEDEEIEFELAKGVSANIKFKAMGELQNNGMCCAYLISSQELNTRSDFWYFNQGHCKCRNRSHS